MVEAVVIVVVVVEVTVVDVIVVEVVVGEAVVVGGVVSRLTVAGMVCTLKAGVFTVESVDDVASPTASPVISTVRAEATTRPMTAI